MTIVFFIYYVILFIKGNPYHRMRILFGEEEIRKQKLGIDSYKPDETLVVKSLLLLLFLVPFSITSIIYLCVGVQIDPYKYPTLVLLVIYIISFLWGVINGRKKVDLSSEEKILKYRKKLEKKRTLNGTFFQILWIAYFSYMAYFLIF
ncbi:hypothetical protein E0Y62_26885 [Cytobacillus praedii]|uniref:Uncharacterized protein n=1 Tax=Cytobacillus praedii TaxID=1742358 RepID=A0A4R1AMD5_9BACI|nr:hypothetical protein E0Y62_26885 [Cytobacillus praedii]